MKEIFDRLDRMDAGFQRLEGKLNTSLRRLEEKMDAGFQKQGAQMEALQDDVKLALRARVKPKKL